MVKITKLQIWYGKNAIRRIYEKPSATLMNIFLFTRPTLPLLKHSEIYYRLVTSKLNSFPILITILAALGKRTILQPPAFGLTRCMKLKRLMGVF